MKITYSDHAKKRMRERGIEEWEIEHVLIHPSYIKSHLKKEKLLLERLRIENLELYTLKKKFI